MDVSDCIKVWKRSKCYSNAGQDGFHHYASFKRGWICLYLERGTVITPMVKLVTYASLHYLSFSLQCVHARLA